MPLALALALGLPAAASMAAKRSPSLRATRAAPAVVQGLKASLTDRCRDQVREEFEAGQRRDGKCREDREAAGRELVRRRDAYGFVERSAVDLSRVQLILGLARRCQQWPLRAPGRDVLRRTDVTDAGCRLRRYQGQVQLVFVDLAGDRFTPLPPVTTDEDGRFVLQFASVDRALRALGMGSIDDYSHIELGADAWAGRIDLVRLLSFRADWHLVWLGQGRGAPGLFVARHPDHPGAEDARTMAADALFSRQEQDYERVRTGTLPPQTFLDWHDWSPYRHRVEALLRTATPGITSGGRGRQQTPASATADPQ